MMPCRVGGRETVERLSMPQVVSLQTPLRLDDRQAVGVDPAHRARQGEYVLVLQPAHRAERCPVFSGRRSGDARLQGARRRAAQTVLEGVRVPVAQGSGNGGKVAYRGIEAGAGVEDRNVGAHPGLQIAAPEVGGGCPCRGESP
jgi:hypothetical protein